MLDATTIQSLAALLAVILAAVGLLNGFILWQIRDLKIEIRRLDDKIDRSNAELREEMLRGQAELREEMRQMEERLLRGQAELREEMRQMEERLLRSQAELREEMRRGFAQLLSALNGHTHDPDTGAAVFHEVPTAADDD